MKSMTFLILTLIQLLSLAYAIQIGIQKDFPHAEKPIQSYSGRITFNEDTKNEVDQYPPQFMSDEKLVKLGVLAYNEMLAIHDSLPLASHQCPGAMIVLASGKDIFFASSMKGEYKSYYSSQVLNSHLNQVLTHCQTISEGPHRTRLSCGEPNVLDVALSSDATLDPSNARITAWLTYTNRGNEGNGAPCGKGRSGYGCARLVAEFELNSIKGKTPDSGDGSEWDGMFEQGENPRGRCSS